MPKATIKTYADFAINQNGEYLRVSKIISEQEKVPNICKEVEFLKYSKKLPIHNVIKSTFVDFSRE